MAKLEQHTLVGFGPVILDALQNLERRAKPQQLILARYFSIPERPRLLIQGRVWRWEFELQGTEFGYGNFEPVVTMEFDTRNLDAKGLPTVQSSIEKIAVLCSCYDSKPCVHAIACGNYLRKQLNATDREAAEKWIHSCISDGRDVGQRIIDELAKIEPAVETVGDESLARLQWRITGINFDNSAYFRPNLE
ncbi:MAG: hypothetical protein ACK53L_36120, partial [Pirellulaceae bacterium]